MQKRPPTTSPTGSRRRNLHNPLPPKTHNHHPIIPPSQNAPPLRADHARVVDKVQDGRAVGGVADEFGAEFGVFLFGFVGRRGVGVGGCDCVSGGVLVCVFCGGKGGKGHTVD